MKKPKDNVNDSKRKYRVKNWPEYNRSLIARGSLTLWISDDVAGSWYGHGHETYSAMAIETMLCIKAIYHLPLRSIFEMKEIGLAVPDYTTIARRAGKIKVALRATRKNVTDMVLDSTGLKVFGEGEWKVRKHGWGKRRTWKKVHIGIDSMGEIRAVVMTGNHTHDSDVVKDILSQEEARIDDFYGDGAYDKAKVYRSLIGRGVAGFHIPPQRNAVFKGDGGPRDRNLKAIRASSREEWKESSGYHTRSLGETAMFRFKRTFGDHMDFRTEERQRNEVLVKCNILNALHSLGVPESYAVT
jgi:Transposase DDE domain